MRLKEENLRGLIQTGKSGGGDGEEVLTRERRS